MCDISSGTHIFELLDRAPAIRPGVGVALDPKRMGPLQFENILLPYAKRGQRARRLQPRSLSRRKCGNGVRHF